MRQVIDPRWEAKEIPSWWMSALSHIDQLPPDNPYQYAPAFWTQAKIKLQEHADALNKGQNAHYGWEFGEESWLRLSYVHPLLALAFVMALKRSPYDIGISEGARTEGKQAILVSQGRSKTMNSRHIPAPLLPNMPDLAAAVDFKVYFDGESANEDAVYETVWQEAILPCIEQLRLKCVWGGAWSEINAPEINLKPGDLRDLFHVQLDWGNYPILGNVQTA